MPCLIDRSFPPYLKSLKRLQKKIRTLSDDMSVLFDVLASEPDQGSLVSDAQSLLEDGKALYKIRVKVVGQGKSGGPRLLYLVDEQEEMLFPLLIYRHQDLTTDDIPDAEVAELVGDFKDFLENIGK